MCICLFGFTAVGILLFPGKRIPSDDKHGSSVISNCKMLEHSRNFAEGFLCKQPLGLHTPDRNCDFLAVRMFVLSMPATAYCYSIGILPVYGHVVVCCSINPWRQL